MKIEIWSDYACPFCYIGKRRLEQALEQFAHKNEVEVEFKSFELDPEAPVNSEQSNVERLARKYQMSIEEVKQMGVGITEQAKEVGLTFHFDDIVTTNTFDAHRLTQFAKTKQKDKELTEKLLHAYFTETKHLGDHATLADIAEQVGIERAEALTVLEDNQAFANEVRDDQRMAKQIGIQGVPFFVINGKYALSGAQSTDTFLSALEKVWQEQQEAPLLQDLTSDESAGGACTDGKCDI